MTHARATPRIDTLLNEAHAALAELEAVRLHLLQRGLAQDDLPAQRNLQAYALLGDHDRAAVIAGVEGHWAELFDRALVSSERPQGVSTPLLRLLSHALPSLAGLKTLDETLATNDVLPMGPDGLLAVEGRVSGLYWGEAVVLNTSASSDVTALRIHGGPTLDLEPVLYRSSGSVPIREAIEFLADEGQLVLTMQCKDGRLFRREVTVKLAQSVEEIWP